MFDKYKEIKDYIDKKNLFCVTNAGINNYIISKYNK